MPAPAPTTQVQSFSEGSNDTSVTLRNVIEAQAASYPMLTGAGAVFRGRRHETPFDTDFFIIDVAGGRNAGTTAVGSKLQFEIDVAGSSDEIRIDYWATTYSDLEAYGPTAFNAPSGKFLYFAGDGKSDVLTIPSAEVIAFQVSYVEGEYAINITVPAGGTGGGSGGGGGGTSNRPPWAEPDGAGTRIKVAQNATTAIDVLGNDYDPDGDTFAFEKVGTAPIHGRATWNATTKRVEYTPDKDYVGIDQFSYIIFDPKGEKDEAAVLVDVSGPASPANRAPTLATVKEIVVSPGASVPINLLAGWSDPDGDVLKLSGTVATKTSKGEVTLAAGSTTATYKAGTAAGPDSFTYSVTDGKTGGTTSTTVKVNVQLPVIAVTNEADLTFLPTAKTFETSEGDTVARKIKFTIDLQGATLDHEPVTVRYKAEGFSAGSEVGKDFKPLEGELTIPKGVLKAELSLETIPDKTREPDDLVQLVLSDPKNATLQGGKKTLDTLAFIRNDDFDVPAKPDAETAYLLEQTDATTGVAAATYQFFTGSIPKEDGFAYLIKSDKNSSDLSDPYYAQFNQENRYLNFAANLGLSGDGKKKFDAEYKALSFNDAVNKAYDEIVGFDAAKAVGNDPNKITDFFLNALPFYRGVASERVLPGRQDVTLDEATKVVAIGSILNEAIKSGPGRYSEGYEALLEDIGKGSATFGDSLLL